MGGEELRPVGSEQQEGMELDRLEHLRRIQNQVQGSSGDPRQDYFNWPGHWQRSTKKRVVEVEEKD